MAVAELDVRRIPLGRTGVEAPGQQIPEPVDAQVVQPFPIRVPARKATKAFRRATPKQLVIGSLSDWRLRLIEPLSVVIEREDESFIARSPKLHEFGYGPRPLDAVEDLRQTVVELYFALKESQAQLGTDLKQLWQRLQKMIEER